MGADNIAEIAIRLATQAGHDPHAMVVRGQMAVGFAPDGVFQFVPEKCLTPLWTLYVRMAVEVKRAAIAASDAS